MSYESVIGLEVHAQVSSRAKLFSGSPTAFGANPNTQVSLVEAAMPGMRPAYRSPYICLVTPRPQRPTN